MIIVSGPMVPALLLAVPLNLWFNLCALQWVHKHSPKLPFGQVLAATILMQQPLSMFKGLILCLPLVIYVGVMYDLGFGVAPIVFASLCALCQLGLTAEIKRRLQAKTSDADFQKVGTSPELVWSKRVHSTDDLH